MNPTPIFHETRPEVLTDLVRSHPFATLVTHADGPLAADHLPFLFDEDASGAPRLRGHLSAQNTLSKGNRSAIDALAVFQGPQTYVSPSWYPSKAEHGKVVPTWNYAVVHVEGRLTFHCDTDWLMAHLTQLTDTHESHRDLPWSVTDAPDTFVARQLRALVGIEIAVTRMTGIWKVSQNRPPADRAGVEEGLTGEPGENARAMARIVADRTT